MVTKLMPLGVPEKVQFESCVVLDGDKTASPPLEPGKQFESCVVLDGDKTSKNSHSGSSLV